MRTDDLIAALAADTLPRPTVARRMGRALPLALGVAGLAFALGWGPRPDLAAAAQSAAVLKTVLPLLAAALAGGLALALARPGARPGGMALALGLFAAGLVLGLGLAIARGGLAGLAGALATPSLAVCLVSIPVLALPVLGAVLWALSAGAALRPRLAGGVAGLMAGALAASVYSLYCDQDAALFVLPAYSVAVLGVALLGGLAGPRLLRW